jgi:hypothetical protein
MTKQTINVGSGELTGDGESLRSALVKTNDNFNEIYTNINTINNAGYITTSTLPAYPATNRISSGTVAVYVTADGKFNLPRGSLLFNNTTSVVASLADITLQQILTHSTTSTDYVPIGTYGNDYPYNAPYTVIQLAITPPLPLFQGDVVASPGFPVPVTIKYAGTGSFATTLILDSDFSQLLLPIPPVLMTVARPLVNDSLTIECAAEVDLVLKPGGSRNTIMHNDLIPFSQYGSSLGSPINRFKHLWMGAGTIYLKDEVTNADSAITSRNGQFTILGTAGLTVGEFTFIDNQIKINNSSREIVIGTTTATGYVNFNRPVKMTGSGGNKIFDISRAGLVSIYPKQDMSVSESALSIVGNSAGLQQPRNFTGTMLQITGQNGIATRVSIDSFGTGAYPVIAGRSARGTVQIPTATKANDVLLRLSTQGYGDNQYIQSIGRITIEATQDFTNARAGTQVVIQTTPNDSNIITTSTIFNNQGIDFDGNATGGITFYNRSRQTTAWTGTVDVSLVNGLSAVAVTSITAGTGLSGGGSGGNVGLNNTGVLTVAGAANQVYVNGGTVPTNGIIALTLPQNIAPTSNVTFNDLTVNGRLNILGTGTNLIPSSVEGTILKLGSTATNVSQIDGGGIILGNTTTGINSILWRRSSNYWDFVGSGIVTQQFNATTSTIQLLNVTDSVNIGVQYSDIDYPNAGLQIDNSVNNYAQVITQNHNSGTLASSDFVATNNIGNDNGHYIDLGINGSNYTTSSWTVNGANDGYLYINQGNLAVGTDTPAKNIVFFTGGTLSTNIRATINDQGLTVASTVTSSRFYGPLTGNIIGDVTGNVSGNAGSVTNGIYSNQTYTNPVWIGSLAGSKITSAVTTATTVVNGVYTTDTGTVSNNMLAGSIANNKLINNQIFFDQGTGINVSQPSPSLGGHTRIDNTGVLSITTGSGIIISTATGNIVISAAVPQGPIGYTGSTGTQGIIGYTGSTGTQGPIGYTGSTGTQGIIGYTGSTGTQGPIGYTGSTGTQGPIGYTGSTGTQGIIGYTGSTGTQGPIGYTGSTGTQGIVGYTGSKGVADVYVSSISTGTGIVISTSTGAVTVSLNTATLMNKSVNLANMTNVIQGTLSIDFANVGKNASSNQIFAVPGLTTSHHIIMQPAAAMTFGLIVTAAWVNATNSATIQVMNLTGGGIDQAAINIEYLAWV